MTFIDAYLDETVGAFIELKSNSQNRQVLQEMSDTIVHSLRNGGKLLICGNGGSAGDAQHIAGEFISRLMFDRDPLPSIALTTDSSVLTAIGNDYGYEHIFKRQVMGLGAPGDVLLGISTSGNSRNVHQAFEAGRTKNLTCIGFTGASSSEMDRYCRLLLRAPSAKTAIVQQLHITAAHIICALVEKTMFNRD